MLKIFTDNSISHPADARLCVREMRELLRHLSISKANFDKGSLRCKVDIQLYIDEETVANKVSFRNLRDFESIEESIAVEALR